MLPTLLLLAAFASRAAPKDGVLHVRPGDSLAQVGQRLAKDPSIREVVLAAGNYPGGWTIPAREGADPESHPLLIRAADGAEVVFDGAEPMSKAKPVPGGPGVFEATFKSEEKREPPKIWEPEARVRYLLAADLEAVRRFPGSYFVTGRTITFHTSDGRPPRSRGVLASSRDFGISVQRRFVTVRGLRFRDFTARAKWSAAVQMRADHVTVERCDVVNASFGFTILSDDDALVECTGRDLGGGVYVAGRRDRVERNRLLKERDRFLVPTYEQDDTGIQVYYPAEGGIIRGNLAVGFGMGILIKAPVFPWVVEENTLVAATGMRNGFVATQWHPDSVFRRNVVAGYSVPGTMGPATTAPGVEHNCYSPDPVADPQFVDARAGDFRLAPGSPCLAGLDAQGIGAGAKLPFSPRPPGAPEGEPGSIAATPTQAASGAGVRKEDAPARSGEAPEARAWHVAPSGSDDATGGAVDPLRTVQAAIDRAGPGDTVLLHPGLYPEPVRIDHGGTADRPITLRATERWKAILDGARRHDALIRIDTAPFVVVQDLEIRWYRVSGIQVIQSEGVRVEGCRIWNAHWGGNWPGGNGVEVRASPRFTGTRDVLFNQEIGFYLVDSPRSAITSNTAVANLYAGVAFVRSIEGSTCIDNSFAYQGNDAISFEEGEGWAARLKAFRCDYNNYGLTLQPGEPGEPPLDPRPQDRQLFTQSKAIAIWQAAPDPYRRFRTLSGWRDFSGLDVHSIFADPLYVETKSYDFRLDPGSPNRGAGSEGTTIGAFAD